MNEKSPVKSYCGGKPNYCTPEETDNVGACVTCGAPKSEWLVDGVNMTPERVDETAKREHEPVYAFRRKGLDEFCTCDKRRYDELAGKPNLFEVAIFYTAPPVSDYHEGWEEGFKAAKRDSSSWVDCTDEQLMEEVRRRGFVIRDAQIGREWVGLTDREITKIGNLDWDSAYVGIWYDFAKGVEAKLKEKNT